MELYILIEAYHLMIFHSYIIKRDILTFHVIVQWSQNLLDMSPYQ